MSRLEDAALDRRVARDAADAAYEKDLTQARERREVAYRKADSRWVLAVGLARAAAVQRREARARYREMSVEQLTDEHSGLAYMLTPVYAPHLHRSLRPQIEWQVGMISAELARRDVGVRA